MVRHAWGLYFSKSSRKGCLEQVVTPPRKGCLEFQAFGGLVRAQTLRRGVAHSPNPSRKGCLERLHFRQFRATGRLDVPNGQFRYHFGAFRPQGRPDAPNGQFRYHFNNYFGADAAQMLQTISLGIFLNPFGPKTAQMLQHMLLMISFATILNHLLSDSFSRRPKPSTRN